MSDEKVYNPLDKHNLGESVEKALLGRPAHPLPLRESFGGAGIYALYYSGDFSAYKPITVKNKGRNPSQPIYVGKAIPSGGRKGGVNPEGTAGKALYKRLNDHIKSIQATKNLDITDFSCRYLVVDDIWIPLGESLLISKFSPLWNVVVDGFGNHTPGSGRFEGMRPNWDTLHPGRPWAEKCKGGEKTEKEILKDIEDFFKSGKR